jgi:iron complex transport system permease protein
MPSPSSGAKGMERGGARPIGRATALFCLGALLLLALCLLAGRYPRPGLTDPLLLLSDPTARAVVLGSRLPRLAAALILGAALAAAGNAFQMVFGNPLVEPGFLGVSQGAALGAALALVAGAASELTVTGAAFALALAALAAAALLARAFPYGGWVLRLVLAGFAVSSFMSAGIALVKYSADPLRELPDIVYWTMGSLSGVSWRRVALAAPPALGSVAFLVAYRWRVTALSSDEAVALSLGTRPALERALVLVVASAGVAAVVAMAGAVGWIGLVVPHAARLLFGADARRSMPASALLGACFAALCDTLARSVLPGELPLGAVTALIGSAAFVALLARGKVPVAR